MTLRPSSGPSVSSVALRAPAAHRRLGGGGLRRDGAAGAARKERSYGFATRVSNVMDLAAADGTDRPMAEGEAVVEARAALGLRGLCSGVASGELP